MSILKLGSICSMAFMLIVFQVLAIAQQSTTSETSDHKQHSETMRECARACSDCQRACDCCATHCGRLASEGEKDHLTTLVTCQDCASVCTAGTQIVARGGPFSALICQSCADACARCGKECEKFAGDQHMKMCADECRKCEKACREMAIEMVLK